MRLASAFRKYPLLRARQHQRFGRIPASSLPERSNAIAFVTWNLRLEYGKDFTPFEPAGVCPDLLLVSKVLLCNRKADLRFSACPCTRT